jgi:hypothetical protein
MPSEASFVEFDIKHLLGNGSAVAIADYTGVLYGVLQVEQNARNSSAIAVVYED